MPSVEWTQNNVVLNNSDSNIIISTTDMDSILTRTNLRNADEGNYNCIVSNILGSINVSIVEVRLLGMCIINK